MSHWGARRTGGSLREQTSCICRRMCTHLLIQFAHMFKHTWTQSDHCITRAEDTGGKQDTPMRPQSAYKASWCPP